MSKKEEKIRYSSLIIDGAKYKTLLTTKFKNRPKFTEKDPGMIKAFIPGTILKIRTREGKRVKEGDLLLILEAMKMKNRIKSTVSGTIKFVNISVGEKVPKGKLLVEIE